MKQKTHRSLMPRFWIAAICALALAACQDTASLPVTEPPVLEELDPLVAELLQPHIAAAKADPEDSDLRATLGLIYETNKLWKLAAKAFANAESLDPNRPEWSFHLALIAMIQGDSEEAERRVVDLCERFPNFGPAHAQYGTILTEAGRFEEALDEFETTTRIQPAWVEGHVSVAATLVHLGRAAEALPILEKVEKRWPEYVRTHYVRGQALIELGRAEEAEAELIAGLGGHRLTYKEQWANRGKDYRVSYGAQNQKAVDLIRKRRYLEARPILERLLERAPADASISNNLSVTYRALNQFEEAVAVLEKSAEKNPTHVPTWVNLAACQWELEDFEGALRSADLAIELAPTQGRARYSRARPLISLNRLEEARTELLESARLDSSQPGVFAVLAETEMKLARYEDAAGHWKTLLEKAPGNFIAKLNLAKCLIQLNRTIEATQVISQLKGVAPNHPELLSLSKQLGL